MARFQRLGALALVLILSAQPGRAEMIPGYPDAVVCETKEGKVVGYLHRVLKDKTAIYMAQDGQYAKVTPDGVFRRHSAVDCAGLTLDQLRKKGKTRDLTKGRKAPKPKSKPKSKSKPAKQ